MKKVLALVLTLAMLVGTLAVGLSAAQVITESKTTNAYWNFPSGNSYSPINVGTQDENFDVEMDIRIDAEGGGLFGWDGLANGPVFTESGVGVGVNEVAISTPITVGEWYHLRLDAEAGSTTVYLNGDNIGTVNAVCTLYEGNQAFWTWDTISVDNLVIGTYSNDMEDASNVGEAAGYQGQQLVDETITYANENVSTGTNGYWNFPAGNSYNPVEVGDQGEYFNVEMDIRLDDASAGLSGWSGLSVGPVFNTSGVGIDDSVFTKELSTSADLGWVDIEVGQWYHLKLDANTTPGYTYIYVDDTLIGAATGHCTLFEGTQAFWTWNTISIDNLQIGSYFCDMEEGLTGQTSDQGQLLTEEIVYGRHDLGTAYWNFPAGNSYAPIDVGSQDENFDVEMDIRIDAEGGKLNGWADLANGPVFTESGVGVGVDEVTISTPITVGEWYHLRLDAEDGSTTVYLDDQQIGTVDTVCTLFEGNQAFWTWDTISIDNLVVGTYSNDMESEEGLGEYQGQRLEYEIRQTTIFDEFSTYEVEGEATLIKPVFNDAKDPSAGNATYLEGALDGTIGTQYIVNFDLAIYPDYEGTISENKYDDGAWVEFIINKFESGDDSRVKVGNKFVGKNKDVYYYGESENGEPEAVQGMTTWASGEFHNVTIRVANGAVTVYIDKQEVYTAPTMMSNWEDLVIFYTNNCGVIIDNFYVYDASTYEQTATGVDFSDDYETIVSDVTLTGADFCAANGHINYWTRTIDPKCYEMGTNTYTCWICGNEDAQQEVPMLEHNFAQYDITRVNEDGLVYTACTTSEGCPERRYVQLPEAEDYTGTITYFHDFQDDFIRQTGSASWYWTIENGVATYAEGNEDNYNEIYLGNSKKTGAELNEGFKLGFDFIYNGTYETVDTAQYGNTFYLHVGRDVYTGSAMVGYDAIAQQFYISSESSFPEVRSEVYALVPGETYNFEVEFDIDHDAMEGVMALYVNGVKVVELDAMTVYDYLTYDDGTEISMFLMRNFGVAMSIDNFVMGNSDFAWNRQYQGDVDGDYAITLSDALLMRRYLAKIDGIETLVASRADANGDGIIDARDQLRIRKAIAAATPEA